MIKNIYYKKIKDPFIIVTYDKIHYDILYKSKQYTTGAPINKPFIETILRLYKNENLKEEWFYATYSKVTNIIEFKNTDTKENTDYIVDWVNKNVI